MEEWLSGFQSGTYEMKTGAAKLVVVHSAIAGSMTTAILRWALVLMVVSALDLRHGSTINAITEAIAMPAAIVFEFDQVARQHAAQKGGPLRGHSGKGLIARCSLEVSRAPPL
jgi:hypothetical protein